MREKFFKTGTSVAANLPPSTLTIYNNIRKIKDIIERKKIQKED